MPKDRFSERYGYAPDYPEIKVREDAPKELREHILYVVYEDLDRGPQWLYPIICNVLRIRPDPRTWVPDTQSWFGPYDIQTEVITLLFKMDWYKVYDLIEAIYDDQGSLGSDAGAVFQYRINEGFYQMGIGWQMVDGKIKSRGDQPFESVTRAALETMQSKGLPTATSELKEAHNDLSRRPDPDLSGVVQHAMSALECVAREATGDSKATFGKIIKTHPGLIPKPIDESLEKIWGWSSNHARHGNENRQITHQEAQLVFGVAAALCSYLSEKLPIKATINRMPWER